MSRLTDLLRQVRQTDTQLARDLEAEISELTNRRTFGLVFESHQPEAVELPGRAIRRGDKVRILAPRGETKAHDDRLWRVQRVERIDGKRVAHLSELEREDPETRTISTDDLVVVAEFNDRIYPGLVETGRVERGGDKPFHTVINAENYHALEMLTYTHRHSIDVIYIDPPYNSGAKDWKYNNNYVSAEDDYRHSKWLAFMQRRLRIARELLNPADSALIVTIDEREVHRLALLIEQLFPEAKMQLITTVISQNGTSREGEFSRVEEFLIVIRLGKSKIVRSNDNMLSEEGKGKVSRIWFNFMRTSTQREKLEGQFYPIFIDPEEQIILELGAPVGKGNPIPNYKDEPNRIAVWPIRKDGRAATWGAVPTTAQSLFENGYLRVGQRSKEGTWSIQYVREGDRKRIANGQIEIVGKRPDGSLELEHLDVNQRENFPKTVWNRKSHDATAHGTRLNNALIPGRSFPYPKSLYAVEDALRFFVKNKPNAKILDFFAGSGTTAHAVMRLNKQDSGERQCISVTNNEVSADEQSQLRQSGFRPGEAEWEALGICEYITKPKITAAITGRTPDGLPVRGDGKYEKYRFKDEFPIENGLKENAAFFTLTYETPLSVRHHRVFERIAPMLWLKAGSRGRIICDLGTQGWDVAEAYAVLENFDRADEFMAELQARSDGLVVYLITDDDAAFQMACRELAAHHQPVRLYESYLHNFQLNIEGTV